MLHMCRNVPTTDPSTFGRPQEYPLAFAAASPSFVRASPDITVFINHFIFFFPKLLFCVHLYSIIFRLLCTLSVYKPVFYSKFKNMQLKTIYAQKNTIDNKIILRLHDVPPEDFILLMEPACLCHTEL